MGPDFQAELPKCFVNGPEMFPPAEESCSEQLLWKPWDELKESTGLQEKGTRPQKKKKSKWKSFSQRTTASLEMPF